MGGIPPALRGEQSSDGVTFSDVHQKGVMWPPPPPHKSRVAERPECFTSEGCWRQLCVDGGVILVWGDDPCMLTTSIITHPVIATHSITCPPPPTIPGQHSTHADATLSPAGPFGQDSLVACVCGQTRRTSGEVMGSPFTGAKSSWGAGGGPDARDSRASLAAAMGPPSRPILDPRLTPGLSYHSFLACWGHRGQRNWQEGRPRAPAARYISSLEVLWELTRSVWRNTRGERWFGSCGRRGPTYKPQGM